jgi:hypothetical protein
MRASSTSYSEPTRSHHIHRHYALKIDLVAGYTR